MMLALTFLAAFGVVGTALAEKAEAHRWRSGPRVSYYIGPPPVVYYGYRVPYRVYYGPGIYYGYPPFYAVPPVYYAPRGVYFSIGF
jgi:hypothetical protein